MRLKEYITDIINEKISRNEKKDALKNKNILIGCEFEFKLDENLGYDSGEEELYEKAYEEFTNYNKEIEDYEEELSEYIEETNNIQEKVDDLNDELSENELAIETSKDSIEDYQEQIKTIKDDGKNNSWSSPSKFVYDKEIKTPQEEIDVIKNLIKDEEKDIDRWTKDTDRITEQINDLEKDIKYREEEGQYEQIEPPYLYDGSYSNYIVYMIDYMGFSKDDLNVDPGEYLDKQPYYEEYHESNNFIDTVETSNILDDAPFSDYEVGDYESVEQDIGSTTWAVESDETVTGDNGVGGLEVANPPTELPKFVPNKLIEMFDWIDEIGYTDSDTGFHVHMSLKNNKYPIDKLKLILFTEENYIYNLFSNRRNNNYVNSIKDKLKTKGVLNDDQIKDTFDIDKIKVKLMTNHYDGVNILDIESGHVEFRYMGGSSYHRKEKEVIDLIASYAYWLSLAADPDFKRKEYIHKVIRILNKSKMYEYYIILLLLKSAINNEDINLISKIKAQTLYDEFKKKYKKYNDYKIEKKTLFQLFDNVDYIKPIIDKYNKLEKKYFHKNDILDLDIYHSRLLIADLYKKEPKI